MDSATDVSESAIALGAPKPAEPGETGLEERQGDDDSFVEIEEGKDDKMRRIAKALEAGDVVEEAHVSCGDPERKRTTETSEYRSHCRCRCLS